MHSIDRPLCTLDSPVESIGNAVLAIFGEVDCPGCLRRAISEAETRALVLRELLGKVEGT
jgi:hypothetical protein